MFICLYGRNCGMWNSCHLCGCSFIWEYLSMSKWIERINCGVVCSIPCHYPVFLLPEMKMNIKFVCQVSFKALWIEWLDVSSGEYKFLCANANKVLLIIELDLVLLFISQSYDWCGTLGHPSLSYDIYFKAYFLEWLGINMDFYLGL